MLQWILGCMCIFQFLFPQGTCFIVGLLGHMVVLPLVFIKNLHTIFCSGCINLHSHKEHTRVPFSPHPPILIVCISFDDGHSDWCEVISHCDFGLHFSNNEWCWASFHVFLLPTFWLGCLLFWYWLIWAAYIFWKLIFCQVLYFLLFSPILMVVFLHCL